MNNDEKIDKIFNDVNEMKVSQARIEGCLHSTPCPALRTFQKKHSEEIAELHNQHKAHIEDHHSSKNFSANWAAIAAVICAITSIVGMLLKD